MSHIYADKLAENDGSSIFPITVKDSEGNIYRIDDEEPDSYNGDVPAGSRPITATLIGKEGAPIPDGSVDYTAIASRKAVVRFEKSGKYAFDEWRSEYLLSELIHKKYEKLGDSYVPFKLLPSGKADEVRAVISINDSGIDPRQVLFKTPKGTVFNRTYNDSDKSYTISLAGGEDGDGQEVYALYPNDDGTYLNLGKLIVISYPEQTYKLVVVPVNGSGADAKSLERELNKLYNPVGITWSVTVDKNFEYSGSTAFLEKGGGSLSAYTSAMKELQGAYINAGNDIDGKAAYLFYINGGNGADDAGRDTTAFMPRNKQFAYVFSQYHPDLTASARTVAHELGHGMFALKHTFDSDYKIAQNATDNLMDYTPGATHIAKWQWDRLYDPGVVLRVFERDEDAMIQGVIFEGIEFWDFAEYIYNGYFVDIFSFRSIPPEDDDVIDVYTLYPHYNEDVDGKDILSYYLAIRTETGRFEYVIGPESYQAFKENVVNYRWAADWMYIAGTPSQSQIRAAIGLREGNIGEYFKGLAGMWGDAISNPEWWTNTAFLYLAPQAKFGKLTAGAQKLVSNLQKAASRGWYTAFDRMARAGYKMNLVGEKTVIATGLNKEIAYFNRNGYLQPNEYLLVNPDPKVYQLVGNFDDIGYINPAGKEITGRLELWKSSGGKYVWRASVVTGKYNINPINIREVAQTWSSSKKVRFNFADNFYKRVGFKDYDNHLRAINFNEEVIQVRLKKGEYLYQYCAIDPNGKIKIGSYFYRDKNINVNQLGFDVEGRVMVRVKLDGDFNFLQSIAADIEDWVPNTGKVFQGGETQLFNPNVTLVDITILK
jgi:hypothetical protein